MWWQFSKGKLPIHEESTQSIHASRDERVSESHLWSVGIYIDVVPLLRVFTFLPTCYVTATARRLPLLRRWWRRRRRRWVPGWRTFPFPCLRSVYDERSVISDIPCIISCIISSLLLLSLHPFVPRGMRRARQTWKCLLYALYDKVE